MCISLPRIGLVLSGLMLVIPSSALAEDEKPQRLNRFVELMESEKPAIGIFSSNVSTRNGANIAGSGLDFVIVDLEHTPYDLSLLEGFLLGMVNKAQIAKDGLQPRTVPFVRVPATGREQLQFVLKQVLDLGPMGVVVPHVETADDARAMVQACRFPQLKGVPDFEPDGKRGVGYGWAARYWGLPGAEYSKRADLWPLDPEGELVLWVMIESSTAIENCREIAETPGVGGLLIGPGDLAFSLGVPLGDPAVDEAIEKIVAATKDTGVRLGTVCGAGDVEKRLNQGFHFLAVGGDGGLSSSVQQALKTARSHKKPATP